MPWWPPFGFPATGCSGRPTAARAQAGLPGKKPARGWILFSFISLNSFKSKEVAPNSKIHRKLYKNHKNTK
jgi:hypothetical protein